MKKLAVIVCGLLLSTNLSYAENSTMSGTVESKCSIWTEVNGHYSNNLAHSLTTLPSSGGIKGSVRLDVLQASAYKARFTAPVAWTSSPPLTDNASGWTSSVVVGVVSVAAMSAYEGLKVVYNNVTEFNLTLAGSTTFILNSSFLYAQNKALPAGTYTSVWKVDCIAI